MPARCSTSSTTSPSRQRPDFVEAYLATAELALDKQDYALAAETLRKAPKDAAEDPRFHYLLARASRDDDRAGAAKALAEALKINPRHVDSLLLQADQLIDAERYAEAEKVLEQVFEVNPREPRAWAYRAVLAHLAGRPRRARPPRAKSALARWADEPRGRPPDRPQALAEVPLRRGGRRSEAGARARPRLPARQGPALPGPAPAGRGGRRAGSSPPRSSPRMATTWSPTTWSRSATASSGFRTLRGGRVPRPDGRPRGRPLRPAGARLLRRARKTLCEKYGVDAHGAGDRRDLPAEEGIRRADVRPARGRRASSASASAG